MIKWKIIFTIIAVCFFLSLIVGCAGIFINGKVFKWVLIGDAIFAIVLSLAILIWAIWHS